jgi:Putative polyhydroxyalkanoic acid system protein (PHA_gran_rgn)
MRITIAHSKGQQQMIQIVDRAFDDAFRGVIPGPLTIANQQKTWQGSVMKFSLVARMGFIKNPISGTVEVTEQDVTIDADLGMLGNLIPAQEVRNNLETRFRKLLG